MEHAQEVPLSSDSNETHSQASGSQPTPPYTPDKTPLLHHYSKTEITIQNPGSYPHPPVFAEESFERHSLKTVNTNGSIQPVVPDGQTAPVNYTHPHHSALPQNTPSTSTKTSEPSAQRDEDTERHLPTHTPHSAARSPTTSTTSYSSDQRDEWLSAFSEETNTGEFNISCFFDKIGFSMSNTHAPPSDQGHPGYPQCEKRLSCPERAKENVMDSSVTPPTVPSVISSPLSITSREPPLQPVNTFSSLPCEGTLKNTDEKFPPLPTTASTYSNHAYAHNYKHYPFIPAYNSDDDDETETDEEMASYLWQSQNAQKKTTEKRADTETDKEKVSNPRQSKTVKRQVAEKRKVSKQTSQPSSNNEGSRRKRRAGAAEEKESEAKVPNDEKEKTERNPKSKKHRGNGRETPVNEKRSASPEEKAKSGRNGIVTPSSETQSVGSQEKAKGGRGKACEYDGMRQWRCVEDACTRVYTTIQALCLHMRNSHSIANPRQHYKKCTGQDNTKRAPLANHSDE
eukprot:comp11874_c0_seq1/m.6516 comp11874_c0_seq1/g.6516  ORF comp11874_c0_seq1/g.6516 comp11874_c0_seq1/m.6516 type:complete len:513 (-) comp11874_c0_seq1:506-2044(-)